MQRVRSEHHSPMVWSADGRAAKSQRKVTRPSSRESKAGSGTDASHTNIQYPYSLDGGSGQHALRLVAGPVLCA